MFGFREFLQQNFPQPGAIWEGGRVRPKKFVTIGNRISHDHSGNPKFHYQKKKIGIQIDCVGGSCFFWNFSEKKKQFFYASL